MDRPRPRLHRRHPPLRPPRHPTGTKAWADNGYTNKAIEHAATHGIDLGIVQRHPTTRGFPSNHDAGSSNAPSAMALVAPAGRVTDGQVWWTVPISIMKPVGSLSDPRIISCSFQSPESLRVNSASVVAVAPATPEKSSVSSSS